MTVLAINEKVNTVSFAIILAKMPFDPEQIDLSVPLVHLGAPCTLSGVYLILYFNVALIKKCSSEQLALTITIKSRTGIAQLSVTAQTL